MEKPFKNEEELTRQWVQEAGLAKPKASFTTDVLEKIQMRPAFAAPKPLVPALGWVGIAAFFVIGIVLLYYFPLEKGVFNIPVKTARFDVLKSLGELEISRNTVYAFVFLSLFLLQIPFLKKFMEKQWD